MILKDLFELNIENKEEYHFCIFLLMEILMLYQQIIK